MTIKKTITAAMLGLATVASAATYEENLELSRTPVDKYTKDNVVSIIEAGLTVTNANPVFAAQKRGLVTWEQAGAWLFGKPEFVHQGMVAVINSSNETLRAQFIEKTIPLVIASEPTDFVAVNKLASLCMREDALKSIPLRLDITKKLVAAGVPVKAAQILYSGAAASLYKNKPEGSEEFNAYCDEVAPLIFDAWLALPLPELVDGVISASRNLDFYSQGGDIVRFYYWLNGNEEALARAASKVKFFVANQGTILWFNTTKKDPIQREIRAAFLAGKAASIINKLNVAKTVDRDFGNKDATTKLFPAITDDTLKIQTALYLNDIDKLIDSVKAIGSKCDAKTIDSIIAPLNDVDASYRTADVKAALANINKKYTLKLYDDRDTWEPILSKIRAMLDSF